MPYPPTNTKKKPILIAIVSVVALAIAGTAVYATTRQNKANHDEPIPIATVDPDETNTSKIDYSPATTKDNEDINAQKENMPPSGQTPPPPPPASGKKPVVQIARASTNAAANQVEIRALITEATEGTCEAVLTKDGSTTVSKTVNVVLQSSYYACEPINIPVTDFQAKGEWQVTLTASSMGASGSEKTTVEIQ